MKRKPFEKLEVLFMAESQNIEYVADKFFLVSTTDKRAVLDIARREHIDGVLAYTSDPAAPTAACVTEKMDLPGSCST